MSRKHEKLIRNSHPLKPIRPHSKGSKIKKVTSSSWTTKIGKKESFFEIEKGGRLLRVRVHFRPQEKGNILWYLSTKSQTGHWSKFILKLEEMEELGFLLLLLSKFCAETMYSDKESIAKIKSLKQVLEKLRKPKAE